MITAMKETNITTLGAVTDRVYDMSGECFDELVPVSDISFDSLDLINIGTKKHSLYPIAQTSIAARLGVPHQYLKKCPTDLQADNLNHWIKHERNEHMFLRFDGDNVRAVFTPRYTPADNTQVLRKLEEVGYGSDVKVQCHMDDTFMVLNILKPEKSFKVNGDEMTPGISIANSEVGLAALSVSAYILRLICTNGLISTEKVTAAKYRHVSSRVLDEFPEALRGLTYDLSGQKYQFKVSMESQVTDPLKTFEQFNREFQLNEIERDALEWAWPKESGDMMFNIIQTYTRAAQYEGLSAESSFKLQKTGGSILALVN